MFAKANILNTFSVHSTQNKFNSISTTNQDRVVKSIIMELQNKRAL